MPSPSGSLTSEELAKVLGEVEGKGPIPNPQGIFWDPKVGLVVPSDGTPAAGSVVPSGKPPAGSSKTTTHIFPGSVAVPQISTALNLSSNSGQGIPTALGAPLLISMVDLVLRSQAEQRANYQQQIDVVRLITDLERTSPTRAAEIATRLGVPSNINFDFLNNFSGGGGNLAASSGGFISGFGQTGGVTLPASLSGSQLSFLASNPNVANVIGDFADSVGLPDIFRRSQAGLVPTSSGLLTGSF